MNLFTCATIALFALALSSAHAATLSAGDGLTFTTSPDGCAVSVLYDAFETSWGNGTPPPKRTLTRSFTLAGTSGMSARFDVRGQSIGDGAIMMRIGTAAPVRLKLGADGFASTRARIGAGRDGSRVTLSLDLPRPTGNELAMLGLDSIDVALRGCGGRK